MNQNQFESLHCMIQYEKKILVTQGLVNFFHQVPILGVCIKHTYATVNYKHWNCLKLYALKIDPRKTQNNKNFAFSCHLYLLRLIYFLFLGTVKSVHHRKSRCMPPSAVTEYCMNHHKNQFLDSH